VSISSYLTNLRRVTQDDIHGTRESTVNGIDGWADKAIAGRGILVDYASWAATQTQRNSYDAMATHAISVDDIKTILAASDTQPRAGDILFVRTGYVGAYLGLDDAGKQALQTAKHSWAGIEQGEDMARWLWEQQFAAIVADNPSLECIRMLLPLSLSLSLSFHD
jgi:hypothetical protein